jgi:hypothetical protein
MHAGQKGQGPGDRCTLLKSGKCCLLFRIFNELGRIGAE